MCVCVCGVVACLSEVLVGELEADVLFAILQGQPTQRHDEVIVRQKTLCVCVDTQIQTDTHTQMRSHLLVPTFALLVTLLHRQRERYSPVATSPPASLPTWNLSMSVKARINEDRRLMCSSGSLGGARSPPPPLLLAGDMSGLPVMPSLLRLSSGLSVRIRRPIDLSAFSIHGSVYL